MRKTYVSRQMQLKCSKMYKVYWCCPKWRIYNGDGSENVTQRVNSRCFGFFAIIPSPTISVSNVGQFFWSWTLKVLSKLGKRKISRFLVFTSFIKREFGKFHVVVAQRQQRNEQKALYTYKASCCFVLLVTVEVVDPIKAPYLRPWTFSIVLFESGWQYKCWLFHRCTCSSTTKSPHYRKLWFE